MNSEQLRDLALAALEDVKGQSIETFDVREMTGITDFMLVVSGTSSRHVKALAGKVAEKAKEAGERPLGVEGEREGDWVLVDLGDVVVHVMTPQARAFYNLEKLWSMGEQLDRRPDQGDGAV